jgi:hypothetical protein
LLVVLVSACSDPGSKDRAVVQASAQSLDVCSLYSKSEAEAVLAETVADPRPGSETCEFKGESGTTALGIIVQQVANPEAREARIALLGLEDEGNEEVSGLGDRAYYSGSQLFVFDGSHLVTVTVGLFGSRKAQRRDSAIAVAQTVLSRL